MEKIFLKPNTKEISIKGASREGYTDAFAYDYHSDDNRSKLGSLFIIGNVKQEGIGEEADAEMADVAYVVNLVASLAKREYYSRPDAAQRDAFTATLRKINDVVEEFFKNKTMKVNIGIFSIADEQLLISKLGKFKLMLAREDRAVDILNNIDLFRKEQVEEKEFSNIVSGNVAEGDRLFAFFPSRSLLAREKTFKTQLLKSNADEFVKHLESIKAAKADFDCTGLYLSLAKHVENIVEKPAKDFAPAPVNKPKRVIKKAPTVQLAQSPAQEAPAKAEPADSLIPSRPSVADKIKAAAEKAVDAVPAAANAGLVASQQAPGRDDEPEDDVLGDTEEEIPSIRSTEWSLAKKSNIFTSLGGGLKNLLSGSGSYIGGAGSRLARSNMKKRMAVFSFILGLLVVGVFVAKKLVVVDPEQRQLNAVVSQVQNDLRSVRDKIAASDLIGARQLMFSSLANIGSVGATNEQAQRAEAEINQLMDEVDKAQDAVLTLVDSVPAGVAAKIALKEGQVNAVASGRYGAIDPIDFDTYENNLYLLNAGEIVRISDIDLTKPGEAVSWLKSGTLPNEPTMIAVDGSIYIMNDSGTLSTYYRGEKTGEVNTYLVSKNADLLVAKDNDAVMYLVNKELGRIYQIDKTTGSLIRTLKVGNDEPLADAILADDGSLYIITGDNRMWEVK